MSFIRKSIDAVELSVRVTPNAKKDSIEGIEIRDDGREYLKIRTRAIADENKANAAVCLIVAKALETAKTNVEILNGTKGRLKTLLVKGKNLDIDRALSKLMDLSKNGRDNN